MSMPKGTLEFAFWREVVSEKTACRFVGLPVVNWPSQTELAELRPGDLVTAIVAEVRIITSPCRVVAIEGLGVKVELPECGDSTLPTFIYLDPAHVAGIARTASNRASTH